MADGGLCDLLSDDRDIRQHVADADLFRILETWEECINGAAAAGASSAAAAGGAADQGTGGARNARRREGRDEEKFGGGGGAPAQKKQKGSSSSSPASAAAPVTDEEGGAAKMSHITVERNRRKQMNEHLAVLRSLMPCFYVKRGDQASIIGGVVDYIKELQQVLRSLEAKKNRKAYAVDQVLSPRPPPPPPLANAAFIKYTPPISPRLAAAAAAVPISPRTPTPGSPYRPPPPPPAGGTGAARPPHSTAAYCSVSPAMTPTTSSSSTTTAHDLSPAPFLPILDSLVTELAARAGRAASTLGGGGGGAGNGVVVVPEVKVEFAGPNLVVKTVSQRAPAQALKIIAVLESLLLEILHVSITTVDDTTVLSFTIKIGIECELSAEELVQEIQQTFL